MTIGTSIETQLMSPTNGLDVFVAELEHIQRLDPELRITSFAHLRDRLSKKSQQLLIGAFSVNAVLYGVQHELVDTPEVEAEDLVRIDGQAYTVNGLQKKLGRQYLPTMVYEVYSGLQQAMYADLGRSVLIQSGYRSPTYQAVTMLRHLHRSGNLAETVHVVAPPFHSQHNDTVRPAIDVMRQSVNAPDTHFERSAEYAWLAEHASDYGFALSFPENNPQGVSFEPWHWRYDPAT